MGIDLLFFFLLRSGNYPIGTESSVFFHLFFFSSDPCASGSSAIEHPKLIHLTNFNMLESIYVNRISDIAVQDLDPVGKARSVFVRSVVFNVNCADEVAHPCLV